LEPALPRLATLKAGYPFDRVFNEGKFTVKENMSLHFVENGAEHSRFGFSVSSRVKHAVERNLLRRRMKEIARQLQGVKPGYDIVFLVRERNDDSFECLQRKMVYLLENRNLLEERE
jgi:ribonuclease P protein component